MTSTEGDTILVNGNNHQNVEQRNSVKRLHDLVHQIEEENDLPSPTKKENQLQTNGHITNDDSKNNNDQFSLENVGPVSEYEIDTDMESEDSWLFESPKKIQTPGQNRSPDKWLKDDISTPELLRVRGSLSAKLEVIAIENRKGNIEKITGRRESHEHRRISKHSRRGSTNSVNSLDWDYDEAKHHANSLSSLTNGDFAYEEEFTDYRPSEFQVDSDEHLSQHSPTSQLVSLGKGRKTKVADPNKPFSLDWSDEEEDLQPMHIDFNSPHPVQRRGMKVAPNPTVVRRGGSGIPDSYRHDNTDYESLTAKPTGMVKPRRAANQDDTDFRTESPQSDDFDMNAPVVPRGSRKAWSEPVPKRTPRIKFAELATVIDIPSPRGSGNIAKPVQRRTPDKSNEVRLRSAASASNLKPRGHATVPKSHSMSDMSGRQEDSMKVNLPVGGDGAVVRRRGPAPSASTSNIAQPRKSKEPTIARVQGIPQVRRSTGSIPTKSESGIARPRQSASPSGIARPRGQAVNQSWQANS